MTDPSAKSRSDRRSEVRELRIHGRGGQGAVIASKLLASALFREGLSVQSFPAFGVERRGAPVTAFLRFSRGPILLRCEITAPHDLIILDPTLIKAIDVTQGLQSGGTILINSDREPETYAGLSHQFRVSLVDASAVARRYELGSKTQPIVNTAILGAFAADSGLVGLDAICEAITESIPGKAEANVEAAREAARCVTRIPLRGGGACLTRARRPTVFTACRTISVSDSSTLANRTGSWKYIQPIYQDKVAPCNAACPVGIDIEGVMNLLRQDKVDEARDLLLRENPLPGVCGRVCDHACQRACSRAQFDEAVNIHAVERMLGDREALPRASAPPRTRTEHVAVVGSGPAGLGVRLPPGAPGLQRHGVRGRSRAGRLAALRRAGIPAAARGAGARDRADPRRGRGDPVRRAHRRQPAVAGPRALRRRVPRHRRAGPRGASSGRSRTCPTCAPASTSCTRCAPAAGELGRRVVVVGGSDTAVDCARTALRLGCRAGGDLHAARARTWPADAEAVEEALREGVRFEFFTRAGGRAGLRARRRRAGDRGDPADMFDSGERPGARARAWWAWRACGCSRRRRARTRSRRALSVPGSSFVLPADSLLTAPGGEAEDGALPPDLRRRGYMLEHGRVRAHEPRELLRGRRPDRRAAHAWRTRWARASARRSASIAGCGAGPARRYRRSRPGRSRYGGTGNDERHALARRRPGAPHQRAQRGGAVRAAQHGVLHARAGHAGPAPRARDERRRLRRGQPRAGDGRGGRGGASAASTAACATTASCA